MSVKSCNGDCGYCEDYDRCDHMPESPEEDDDTGAREDRYWGDCPC